MLPYLDKKFFADVIKGLEVTRSFCVTQVSPKCYHKCPQKTEAEGRLPWWCSGWESAWQRRGHGFDHWSGKIPHPAGQLSLCTATTEAALSKSVSLGQIQGGQPPASPPRLYGRIHTHPHFQLLLALPVLGLWACHYSPSSIFTSPPPP